MVPSFPYATFCRTVDPGNRNYDRDQNASYLHLFIELNSYGCLPKSMVTRTLQAANPFLLFIQHT